MPTTPVRLLRLRRRLAGQDRRSALAARHHGALAILMAAERLSDVAGPACTRDGSPEAARTALDVLWRTLHLGAARRTTHWNPGVAHERQAADVRRWGATASATDVTALLRRARRVAADELDSARSGRRPPAVRSLFAVPSL